MLERSPALASGNSLNYTFLSPPPQLLHSGLGEGRREQKRRNQRGKVKYPGARSTAVHLAGYNSIPCSSFSKGLGQKIFPFQMWVRSLGWYFGAFSPLFLQLFMQHLISVLAWGEPSCVLSPLPSPWASSCPGRGLSRALILPCSFLFLFPLLPPIPQPCSAVYHMKP